MNDNGKLNGAGAPAAPPPEKNLDVNVQPFVMAFARMAAGMGKDLGLLALEAIKQAAHGPQAVIWWDGKTLPESVKLQLPPDINPLEALLIPAGQEAPPWFNDKPGEHFQTYARELANGSTLIVVGGPPEEADAAI